MGFMIYEFRITIYEEDFIFDSQFSVHSLGLICERAFVPVLLINLSTFYIFQFSSLSSESGVRV